jgi:hypothetical protein
MFQEVGGLQRESQAILNLCRAPTIRWRGNQRKRI